MRRILFALLLSACTAEDQGDVVIDGNEVVVIVDRVLDCHGNHCDVYVVCGLCDPDHEECPDEGWDGDCPFWEED